MYKIGDVVIMRHVPRLKEQRARSRDCWGTSTWPFGGKHGTQSKTRLKPFLLITETAPRRCHLGPGGTPKRPRSPSCSCASPPTQDLLEL